MPGLSAANTEHGNVYNRYSPIGIAEQLFSQYCFSFVFIAFGFSLVASGGMWGLSREW